MKSLTEQRIEQGLCKSCGGKPETGYKQCRACLDRQYRRRNDDIANGICVTCHKNKSEEGKVKCEPCLAKYRSRHASYARGRNAIMRKQGICVGCHSEPAIQGKRKCEKCYKQWNASRKSLRAERKSKGLCTECGEPVFQSFTRCEAHYYENKEICKKRKEKLLNAGICIRCSKNPLASTQYCADCCLGVVAFSLWGDRSQIQVLKDLFDKQNGICPYSGRKLVIGQNASIDHRIPKSKGGSDNLDNLQWVDLDVNRMKLDHSEVEFIALIKEVVKYKS